MLKFFTHLKKMSSELVRHFYSNPVECENQIHWQEWTDHSKIYCAWIGHATLLLKINGIFIITDPVFSKVLGVPIVKHVFNIMREVDLPLSIKDLPPIDLLLLSHAHMDHLDFPTLKEMAKCDTIVTAKNLQDLLTDISARQVFYLDDGETVNIQIKDQNITIQAVKPNHWGARILKDKHRLYTSILVKFADDKSVFFAGDTAYTDNFSRENIICNPTLALMPISAYDPFITSHCTPEQAINMAVNMQAENVLAYHHETFNLAREPMDEPRKRYESHELHGKINRISLNIGETVRI